MPRRLTLPALAAAAVAAASLIACGATEPAELPATEVLLRLDGQQWEATEPAVIALSVYSPFSLRTDRFVGGPLAVTQTFRFSVAPSEWRGVGTYPLAFRRADSDVYYGGFSESQGGDAGLASYFAIGDDAGTGGLVVTHYDEATGEVEGHFEGTFAVRPSELIDFRRTLPDTFRVTDGRFRGVIEDTRYVPPGEDP